MQARHHTMGIQSLHTSMKPEQHTWQPRHAARSLRDGLLLAADAAVKRAVLP